MIQFQDVTKDYGDGRIAAVNNVSFTIDEGEFVFLIGPSGSGKTTLIEMLIRDVKPSSGKIYFDDIDITNISRNKVYKLRRQIGVIFQDFKLIPDKTAYENVAFAMEAAGRKSKDIKETVPYLLDVVGLEDRMKAFPRELSGGEQQRVAIARAMANNPRILIADEPTGNLDPASAWDIVQILAKINSWGTTVIMSTHGTDIVNTLNKRVIQMQKGAVVRDDSAGQYEFYDESQVNIEDSEEEIVNQKATKTSLNVNLTNKIKSSNIKEQEDQVEEETENKSLLSRFAFWKSDPVDEVLEDGIEQNENYESKYDLDDVNIEEQSKPSRSLYIKLGEEQDKKTENEKELSSKSSKTKKSKQKEDDSELEEILNNTQRVDIEFLNLPGKLIKNLKKAGYQNVGQIIEEGPENLANNSIIDPKEVILVAKSIEKVIEDRKILN